MVSYEDFMKIKHLYEHRGLNIAQIAKEIDMDDRTVAKWLKEDHYRQRVHGKHISKLDRFKDSITCLLERHPYSAAQIFHRLQQDGYDGGYTIVKDYVRKIRPRRILPFLKLNFTPGECAQVDWGSYGTVAVGSTRRKLSFFVMVLCYSRMMYVEFTVSQTMEHFLGCHHNAFMYFGGVPKKIMIDNLKSGVISHITGHEPVLNPKYLDFSHHFGFTITPCGVRKPNEKGRVENGVGYVKANFLSGLDISDFAMLHPSVRQWLDTVANIRIHGETRQKPADMLNEERPFLLPLTTLSYDAAVITPVRATKQFRITYDANRYSVPAEYAGERLTLKAYPDRICVYHQDQMISRHVRSYDRHQDFENPDHPKELLAQRKKAKDQNLLMRLLALSPRAHEYYRQLEQRRMNLRHHVAKIVGLSEIYGVESVARAIDDAFTFHAFSSEYIANLLEQRKRFVPELGALHVTRREDLLEIELEPPDLSVYHQSITKGKLHHA